MSNTPGPLSPRVAGVAFLRLWAQCGRQEPAGAAGAPSPQKVGDSPEGQLPTGAMSSAHTARRTAAMERYSASTTTQGQARAACGQLVESGSCEARNRGRALQTMQKNTKTTQPGERVAALLTGSRTIALHWNKDGGSWGEGKHLHPEGSGEERPALPPCLATAMATTTATAMGTASPSPRASSAWSKLGFRSVAWTQRWEGGNKK